MIIKRMDIGGGYSATIYAYPTEDRDAPPEFSAEISGPEGANNCYYAGRDIEHAIEAVAAARNSGFNFDRFRAEQRLAAAAERDELDLY